MGGNDACPFNMLRTSPHMAKHLPHSKIECHVDGDRLHFEFELHPHGPPKYAQG